MSMIEVMEVVPVEEKELGTEVTRIEAEALALTVRTQDDYKKAVDAVKLVKAAQKKVEEYWEPMRKSTYAAYKSVTDHKKQMTDPLKKAEQIIKGKMGDFQKAEEEKRIRMEENLRRLAREEMERKLAEAAEAENIGDDFGAEYAMAEAEALDDMAVSTHIERPDTKVDGVSRRKGWTITDIDLMKLPNTFSGVLIRPADEKAIMRLIRESGGKVQIPGVEYEETVSFAVKVS